MAGYSINPYSGQVYQGPNYGQGYFPFGGQPQNFSNPVVQAPQVQPQQNISFAFIQGGEASAKSFLVGAGQTVWLLDSDNNCFYIKSADASGVPLPLRIFDYTERTASSSESPTTSIDMTNYVTRDELKKWANDLKSSIMKERRSDGGKSSV